MSGMRRRNSSSIRASIASVLLRSPSLGEVMSRFGVDHHNLGAEFVGHKGKVEEVMPVASMITRRRRPSFSRRAGERAHGADVVLLALFQLACGLVDKFMGSGAVERTGSR
ncbi:MAG: hypothetical protein IPO20_21125 [Gammaproteobacteria bacterium]|nr:hypothetical protein [Gammaproteobacteria bacterium]